MFESEIKKYPDIKIIYSHFGGWGIPKSLEIIDDALTRFPNKKDIDAVYAHCDGMALGAIRALKGAGRLEDVLVIGIDGNPIGLVSVLKVKCQQLCTKVLKLLGFIP